MELPFTRLQPAQFRKLVRLVAERGCTPSLMADRTDSGPVTCRIGCCWYDQPSQHHPRRLATGPTEVENAEA
ncbi:Protein of unknown function [Micromonospora lupini str. Lupac 08]|uniref:Uncharacterized protein n=1 Tax=Micromonospora lupini str. Lupac 08 TaxID=1150864 RepID=I0L604_9ACTN|nr:Protein of unknown function [Micromonospora lupini str. Lupac 08]